MFVLVVGGGVFFFSLKENYELMKKSHVGEVISSKDMISTLARQWANTSEEEKQIWKYRADQMKESLAEVVGGNHSAAASELEEGSLPEPPDDNNHTANNNNNTNNHAHPNNTNNTLVGNGGGKRRAVPKKVTAKASV